MKYRVELYVIGIDEHKVWGDTSIQITIYNGENPRIALSAALEDLYRKHQDAENRIEKIIIEKTDE